MRFAKLVFLCNFLLFALNFLDAFGVVNLGYQYDGMKIRYVALKSFPQFVCRMEDFDHEVSVMKLLHHETVISFITEDRIQKEIVTEYMEFGSLKLFLQVIKILYYI